MVRMVIDRVLRSGGAMLHVLLQLRRRSAHVEVNGPQDNSKLRGLMAPRHAAALLRTSPARVGADAAVLVMRCVLLALRRTGVASLCTCTTERGSECTAARHHPYRSGTRLCAIPVEPNALGEHLWIFLVQACIRAHFARDETLDAGFEARVIRRALRGQVLAEIDVRHAGPSLK